MTKSHEVRFHETASHPLGRVWKAATHTEMPGTFASGGRKLFCYALVLITRGHGRYFDPTHHGLGVRAGDLMLIFPDVPHSYQAVEEGGWDELYLAFDGPLFDLMQEQGVLRTDQPIYQNRQVDYWAARMHSVYQSTIGPDAQSCLKRLTAMAQLLGDLAQHKTEKSEPIHTHTEWLQKAYARLQRYACQPDIDWDQVAKEMGMSYQVFRKRFSKYAGMPPARYVAEQTIARATELLWDPSLSVREVGEACGFTSEYHFSRRFKQIMGVSPSYYRREK